MSGSIEVITFTENCNQMECMGGMRLQSWFLTDGHFVYPNNAGYLSWYIYIEMCVCSIQQYV